MGAQAWVLINTNVRVHYNIPWDLAQIEPGGATFEAAKDASRGALHYVRDVIEKKHSRSGYLAASLRSDTSKRGTKVVRGIVRSDIEHAKWFFFGTAAKGTGRIYPKSSGGLALQEWDGQHFGMRKYNGRPYGSPRPIIMPSVQGQPSHENIVRDGAKVGLARVAGGFGVKSGVRIRR